MNICYIIGAGELKKPDFTPDESDMVICADAGYRYALDAGIRVDLVVGDFDSLGHVPEGVQVRIFPAEKDDTDSFIAVDFGMKEGYKRFELYGLLGGRLDHTYSNLELLSFLVKNGCTANAYGNGVRVFMLRNSSMRLPAKGSGLISIFSFIEESRGVDITGLKYEVRDFTMTNSLTRGLSNEFVGREAEIRVADGQLIVFEEVKAEP